MENQTEIVKDYYGKQLKQSSDLKTNACCTTAQYPDQIKKILSEIHEEVLNKYYGCGLTIPSNLSHLRILDLGSGSGRDCYIASKLVGENGYIIGIDITDEQLETANRHISYHTEKFGYSKPNVEFRKGHIEQLDELNLENNSLDLIISNCVINLSTNKQKVLNDCFQKLKLGGEMYFSDIYANKRISKELSSNSVIYGECLGGALYWKDFLTFARKAGFTDPRSVEFKPVTIENPELEKALESYEFNSVTYRLFKIEELEDNNEDYGQKVIYKGSIDGYPDLFLFDKNNLFKVGQPAKVSGNTYLMLQKTRFKDHFDFIGSHETHWGDFTTPDPNPFTTALPNQNDSPQSPGPTGNCC